MDLLAHLFLLFFVIDLLELTFTILFFIEMVLRMYGLGIHGYFRSAFNKYDFSVRNINYTPTFLRLFIRSYVHSFVHSFICLFTGLFVLSSTRSFVPLLIININYTPTFLRLFIRSYVHSFVHSFICSFTGLFVLSSTRSFVPLLVHLFFHLFVYRLLINWLYFPFVT